MQFAMMKSANGNSELVADFPPHRALFCKLDVVRIRGGSTANKAGVRGHKLQMLPVALAHRLADHRDRPAARIVARGMAILVVVVSFRSRRLSFTELVQSPGEGVLNGLGVFGR